MKKVIFVFLTGFYLSCNAASMLEYDNATNQIQTTNTFVSSFINQPERYSLVLLSVREPRTGVVKTCTGVVIHDPLDDDGLYTEAVVATSANCIQINGQAAPVFGYFQDTFNNNFQRVTKSATIEFNQRTGNFRRYLFDNARTNPFAVEAKQPYGLLGNARIAVIGFRVPSRIGENIRGNYAEILQNNNLPQTGDEIVGFGSVVPSNIPSSLPQAVIAFNAADNQGLIPLPLGLPPINSVANRFLIGAAQVLGNPGVAPFLRYSGFGAIICTGDDGAPIIRQGELVGVVVFNRRFVNGGCELATIQGLNNLSYLTQAQADDLEADRFGQSVNVGDQIPQFWHQ